MQSYGQDGQSDRITDVTDITAQFEDSLETQAPTLPTQAGRFKGVVGQVIKQQGVERKEAEQEDKGVRVWSPDESGQSGGYHGIEGQTAYGQSVVTAGGDQYYPMRPASTVAASLYAGSEAAQGQSLVPPATQLSHLTGQTQSQSPGSDAGSLASRGFRGDRGDALQDDEQYLSREMKDLKEAYPHSWVEFPAKHPNGLGVRFYCSPESQQDLLTAISNKRCHTCQKKLQRHRETCANQGQHAKPADTFHEYHEKWIGEEHLQTKLQGLYSPCFADFAFDKHILVREYYYMQHAGNQSDCKPNSLSSRQLFAFLGDLS
jgi:hypothetical protein